MESGRLVDHTHQLSRPGSSILVMLARTVRGIVVIGSGGSVALAWLGEEAEPLSRVYCPTGISAGRQDSDIDGGAGGANPVATVVVPTRLPGWARLQLAGDCESVRCRQHDDLDPVVVSNGVVERP